MPNDHDTDLTDLLAAYSLDALDLGDQRRIEGHLADCAECRVELDSLHALRARLHAIPPEAFLEGPPDNADFLLRRIVRATRQERGRGRVPGGARWLSAAAGVAVTVALGAAIATGITTGQHATTDRLAAPPAAGATQPGRSTISGANPATGIRLTATVTRNPGWIQVDARFIGVPPGTRCKLLARTRDGGEQTVLAWVAPPDQPATGVELQGAVLVDARDLTALAVTTVDGRPLVTAPA